MFTCDAGMIAGYKTVVQARVMQDVPATTGRNNTILLSYCACPRRETLWSFSPKI